MRKTILILTMLACTGLSQMSVKAQSGQTGNLFWSISNDTLTISGNDTMPNYTSNSIPWYSSRNTITIVIIGDSVKSIGEIGRAHV